MYIIFLSLLLYSVKSPTRACAPLHNDSQCFPVTELLIINTLATAKPRAEPEAEAEADSEHFDKWYAPLLRSYFT